MARTPLFFWADEWNTWPISLSLSEVITTEEVTQTEGEGIAQYKEGKPNHFLFFFCI